MTPKISWELISSGVISKLPHKASIRTKIPVKQEKMPDKIVLELIGKNFRIQRYCSLISPSLATPPTCYKSLSGPSGPKCPESVLEGVPENRGVRGSIRRGVPGALSAPTLGPDLWSVQKVS